MEVEIQHLKSHIGTLWITVSVLIIWCIWLSRRISVLRKYIRDNDIFFDD